MVLMHFFLLHLLDLDLFSFLFSFESGSSVVSCCSGHLLTTHQESLALSVSVAAASSHETLTLHKTAINRSFPLSLAVCLSIYLYVTPSYRHFLRDCCGRLFCDVASLIIGADCLCHLLFIGICEIPSWVSKSQF